MAREINKTIKEHKLMYLHSVVANGNFHLLFNSDDVEIVEGKNQQNTIQIFLTKFRKILMGFRIELIESYKGISFLCLASVYLFTQPLFLFWEPDICQSGRPKQRAAITTQSHNLLPDLRILSNLEFKRFISSS